MAVSTISQRSGAASAAELRAQGVKQCYLHDIDSVLFTPKEVSEIIDCLAASINADYHDAELVVIGVLKGSFFFLPLLVNRLEAPCLIDFVVLESYRGTESSGEVMLKKDIGLEIKGRDVLIVEDIADTRKSLAFLREHLMAHEPASLKICCLLDKPSRKEKNVPLDYVGAQVPDQFVVGCGLDFNQRYRDLQGIYVLKKELYS